MNQFQIKSNLSGDTDQKLRTPLPSIYEDEDKDMDHDNNEHLALMLNQYSSDNYKESTDLLKKKLPQLKKLNKNTHQAMIFSTLGTNKLFKQHFGKMCAAAKNYACFDDHNPKKYTEFKKIFESLAHMFNHITGALCIAKTIDHIIIQPQPNRYSWAETYNKFDRIQKSQNKHFPKDQKMLQFFLLIYETAEAKCKNKNDINKNDIVELADIFATLPYNITPELFNIINDVKIGIMDEGGSADIISSLNLLAELLYTWQGALGKLFVDNKISSTDYNNLSLKKEIIFVGYNGPPKKEYASYVKEKMWKEGPFPRTSKPYKEYVLCMPSFSETIEQNRALFTEQTARSILLAQQAISNSKGSNGTNIKPYRQLKYIGIGLILGSFFLFGGSAYLITELNDSHIFIISSIALGILFFIGIIMYTIGFFTNNKQMKILRKEIETSKLSNLLTSKLNIDKQVSNDIALLSTDKSFHKKIFEITGNTETGIVKPRRPQKKEINTPIIRSSMPPIKLKMLNLESDTSSGINWDTFDNSIIKVILDAEKSNSNKPSLGISHSYNPKYSHSLNTSQSMSIEYMLSPLVTNKYEYGQKYPNTNIKSTKLDAVSNPLHTENQLTLNANTAFSNK